METLDQQISDERRLISPVIAAGLRVKTVAGAEGLEAGVDFSLQAAVGRRVKMARTFCD